MQNRAMPVFLLLLSLNCPSAVFAQSGRTVISNIDTLFSSWNGYQATPAFKSQAAQLLDYEAMAKDSLGPDWNKLSPAQQREFVTAFRTLMEQRYYGRWHREFAGGSLHYMGESRTAQGTVVKTVLVVNKQTDLLLWHLDKQNRVADLQVNNKDLISIIRGRFHLLLQKKGFKGLLAWINSHLDTNTPSKTS